MRRLLFRTPVFLAQWCTVMLVMATASPAAAQDSLAGARDLYASAAYEDALALLNRLRSAGHPSDDARLIEQYRAFCLLALGRSDEAQRAIEAVVAAQPSYRPSEADLSPRVRQAFSDVRRRMLPSIIQDRYAQAKASFDRKEFIAASTGFRLVLEALADPDLASAANRPPLVDLRTLAAGFYELSEKAAMPGLLPASTLAPLPALALPEPSPASPRSASPRSATLRPASPAPSSPAPSSRAPSSPALSSPAPSSSLPSSAAPAPRFYSAEDPNVAPPVVVQQTFPPYPSRLVPPSQGVLEVIIDETGAVQSARMIASVNPAYDGIALAAARGWLYKPALLNGTPVKYRKVIQILLKPSR